jgi:tryptophan-rich sensory protein
VGFVGLCLLVGAAGGALTATSADWYPTLRQPPGTPPSAVFGPVWTALYCLLGVSGWLVWRRTGAGRAVRLWGWQLAINALWVPAFFGLRSPGLGLVVMVPLLILAALTVRTFARIRRPAAWLMAPYLAWLGYAAYLNAGFVVLNPP